MLVCDECGSKLMPEEFLKVTVPRSSQLPSDDDWQLVFCDTECLMKCLGLADQRFAQGISMLPHGMLSRPDITKASDALNSSGGVLMQDNLR